MSISKNQLLNLSAYPTSSWAVWSENFNQKECLEADIEPQRIFSMIENQLEKLKIDIVFVGLNRSLRKGKTAIVEHKKFGNFHSVVHRGDAFLKQKIEKYHLLTGAYMTDLSYAQESNSKKVMVDNLNSFLEQLSILSCTKYYIICFGEKVFRSLLYLGEQNKITNFDKSNDVERFTVNYNSMVLNFYKIIHYSYAVRYNHQDRFERQLIEIEKMILLKMKQ